MTLLNAFHPNGARDSVHVSLYPTGNTLEIPHKSPPASGKQSKKNNVNENRQTDGLSLDELSADHHRAYYHRRIVRASQSCLV